LFGKEGIEKTKEVENTVGSDGEPNLIDRGGRLGNAPTKSGAVGGHGHEWGKKKSIKGPWNAKPNVKMTREKMTGDEEEPNTDEF
jgi:hypothetical protein